MALSESRKAANRRWDRENTKQIALRFMVKSDADVIEHLNKQENKTDYIRRLIRADMADSR